MGLHRKKREVGKRARAGILAQRFDAAGEMAGGRDTPPKLLRQAVYEKLIPAERQ